MRQAETVQKHWLAREFLSADVDREELVHVPFPTVGKIRIRLRDAGPLGARRIDVEDMDFDD